MLKLYNAFLNTCAGFAHGLRTERAIQQEAFLLAIGLPLAFWIGATGWERLALVLALVAVLCVEFLNTAIEKLCDHVTPERHDTIKAIKDMGSAACFCAQAGCGLIWLFAAWQRFWP
ncbi:MAG TPA: diacylglycerol kinase [Beijerinckiaceae bacterium]|nr:diacylglycerol kinase [Beijerinckiaceae bacterium]